MVRKVCSKLESSKIAQFVIGVLIVTGLTVIVYCLVVWAQSPLVYVLVDESVGSSSLVDYGIAQAGKEYQFKVATFTEKDAPLLHSNFSSSFFAGFKRPSLVIVFGEKFRDSGTAWAKDYPGIDFVFISPRETQGLSNVGSVTVSTYGASYLAGVLAVQQTEEGIIGIIIGQRTPVTDEYLAGFSRGVYSLDGSRKVRAEYLASDSTGFNNPLLAREVAEKMYSENCDVIFSIAGKSNPGVVAAAEESDRYVILGDTVYEGPSTGVLLASVYTSADTALYHVIDDWFEGVFSKGVTRYGLEHGYANLVFNPRFKYLIPRVMEFKSEAIRYESLL